MRECGSCAMCCKVLPITEPEDIIKPGNVWCKYWSKKTLCKIYDTRPDICRDFYCAWIENEALPDELRPDRCGAVMKFTPDEKLIVVVDSNKPDAWRKGLLGEVLKVYEHEYVVYIGDVKIATVAAIDGNIPVKDIT